MFRFLSLGVGGWRSLPPVVAFIIMDNVLSKVSAVKLRRELQGA